MVRLGQIVAAAGLALLVPAACAPAMTPSESIADRTIRAIYADDVPQVQSAFTPALRVAVTRPSVARLSAVMHAFGKYEYVEQIAALDNGRYDLEAQFGVGSMLVQMRLDGAGRIAALHVMPNAYLKKTARH